MNDLFESAKLSTVDQKLNEIKEGVYRESNVVLGKAKGFGHVLPAKTQTKDFAFGVKESASTSAKNLLYPEDDGTELKSVWSGMLDGFMNRGCKPAHSLWILSVAILLATLLTQPPPHTQPRHLPEEPPRVPSFRTSGPSLQVGRHAH